MDSREIVLSAYQQLQAVIEKERGITDFDLKANRTLKNYHNFIEKWDREEPLDHIWEFIIGENANNVSGEGMAKMALPNFRIFIEDQTTQNKLGDLLYLRKHHPIGPGILKLIEEIDLHTHLESFSFERGSKPRLYLNRLLLMTFIEIMTTIANPNDLNKKAERLGIRGVKSFARLQFQLRDKVNDELNILGIIPKSKFEQAAIAWHL
jgi:hypothetical protein